MSTRSNALGLMVLISLACNSTPGAAPKPAAPPVPAKGLEFGAVRVEMGMSQDDALSRLQAARLDVRELGAPNDKFRNWMIWRGQDVLGNVTLAAGRVVGLRRQWGPEDGKAAYALANTLIRVIRNQHGDGKGTCTVYADTSESPAGSSRAVFLDCGGAVIQVSAVERSGGFRHGSLDEVLSPEGERHKAGRLLN